MISQVVEDRLIEHVEQITDVTVHIDPEDDENAPTCRGLPLRAEAVAALEQAWEQSHIIPAQREVRLHYLSGRIDVELVLPLSGMTSSDDSQRLRDRLVAAAETLPWFGGLRLLYS